MQRRIKQANGRWKAGQCLENAFKIFALIGQQLLDCLATVFFVFSKNHFPNRINTIAFEEHVLCAAKTDASGTKGNSIFDLSRSVCIGSHLHLGGFSRPIHDLLEVFVSTAALGCCFVF